MNDTQRMIDATQYAVTGPHKPTPAPLLALPDLLHELREAIGNEYMDERARRRLTVLADKIEAARCGVDGDAIDEVMHVIDRWCRPTPEAMNAIRAALQEPK